MFIARSVLLWFHREPETWVYCYDPETEPYFEKHEVAHRVPILVSWKEGSHDSCFGQEN